MAIRLFVQALFKLEVPEIQQGIVEIRAAAREVGSRTKIAVFSRDDSIDPVGACVGLKGSRVQAVVNELNGERIDIVPWSSDPERFAKLALAPARVARVFSDPAAKTIQAVVDEDQLSLAIGRNGQNVRLASELTGWKIDLYSSREWMERGGEHRSSRRCRRRRRTDAPTSSCRRSRGCAPATVAVLEEAGYRTLERHHRSRARGFPALPGIAPEEADRIMTHARRADRRRSDDERDGRRCDASRRGSGGIAMDDAAARRELLRLVGLGLRARRAVVGVEQVRMRRSEGQAGAGARRAGRVAQQPGQGRAAAEGQAGSVDRGADGGRAWRARSDGSRRRRSASSIGSWREGFVRSWRRRPGEGHARLESSR